MGPQRLRPYTSMAHSESSNAALGWHSGTQGLRTRHRQTRHPSAFVVPCIMPHTSVFCICSLHIHNLVLYLM